MKSGVYLAVIFSLLLSRAFAADMPPGIPDPDKAIQDPSYNDPVFFWRLTSQPENPYEPEPYFYWPPGVVHGAPQPFFPARAQGDHEGTAGEISDATLKAMATWAEEHGSNALIVIHKGRLLTENYWNGMTADEIVNGRAITRSVTPMLLGFAVADGKLKLDDPIGRYITEWKTDLRGKVTVRQLAQNVSGLEVAPQLGLRPVYGNKDLCLVYCGDVVRAALSYDYAIEPGTKFETAQENTQLLALVIERATGTSVQELLSERVWKKIGAADAAFQLDRPGGVARVMCCMRATPRDWARLGVLVMQNGVWEGQQILPKGWVDIMATPSKQYRNFGLGLWLGSPLDKVRSQRIPQSEPFKADDTWIMEGGGFRIVHMVPSQDLVIYRHGVSVPDWDASYLVNTAMGDLLPD
ncbi:serine hydrolase [Parahaliea maris]|uniref:Serine hydrolase n=1 Tax=Parahaliea maris TaxID=2716870 RepID=A0A5C8ZWE3_9GAMM|nr:serine hydrolase [Parahaliea maris]TXS91912.1 serine hydrolase [Parahaliea maris]